MCRHVANAMWTFVVLRQLRPFLAPLLEGPYAMDGSHDSCLQRSAERGGMGRRAINGSGVRVLGVPALRMAFILRLSGAAAAGAGIEAAADATAKGTKIAASTIITTGRWSTITTTSTTTAITTTSTTTASPGATLIGLATPNGSMPTRTPPICTTATSIDGATAGGQRS